MLDGVPPPGPGLLMRGQEGADDGMDADPLHNSPSQLQDPGLLMQGWEGAGDADPIHHKSPSQLQELLEDTRAALAKAMLEARELQAWSGSEEEDDEAGARGATRRKEDPGGASLAKLSAREREAAVKRAKNREAARRSRQRKTERINALYKDIRALQQEGLVLLKCVESFAGKALAAAAEQEQLREQLRALGAPPQDAAPPAPAAPPAAPLAPAPAAPAERPHLPPASPAGGVHPLSLPSLGMEELQRFQAMDPAQLSARATLSARAAVAEHMAMLSRDNSPRDDEAAAGGAAAAAGQQRQPEAQQAQQAQQAQRAKQGDPSAPSPAGRLAHFLPAGSAREEGGENGAGFADLHALFKDE